MQAKHGGMLAYAEYLERTAQPGAEPVVWSWREVETEITGRQHNVQGTVALSGAEVASGGTVAPGLSLVIQVLNPGESTKHHRHSFWHLYIVRSGVGAASFGDAPASKTLVEGDVLFVPAWCYHAVSNREGSGPLVLFRLQNLPQNASTGNLAREDDGQLKLIYASVPAAVSSAMSSAVSSAFAAPVSEVPVDLYL
jgi:gentisate 1,2-dioxygenase